MSTGRPEEWIVVTEDARTLPVIELLTGRGFVTGKSGSGKSNSASVIAEELLDANFNLLVVDIEGEHYGLKEQFQVLHVGADEFCDVQVGPEDAEDVADVALNKNMPTVVDVSGYTDVDESKELVKGVLESLYEMERRAEKPFLVIVEEIQEYLPQSGGKDELAKLLIRVAKRGRKRGLGITGISQRPSSVDKDFITQCDWMVWHRLTWKNDIGVVRDILGGEVADEITELSDGEGYLMTDWDESVERVQFKRKRTFDAGATPGLQEYDRPDLIEVSQDLIGELGDGDGDRVDLSDPSFADDGDDGGRSGGDIADGAEATAVRNDATGDEGDDTGSTGGAGEDGTGDVDDREAISANDRDPTTGTALDGEFELAPGDEALESLDREELLEAAKQSRRRAEVFEDEVAELRSVLETAEQRDAGAETTPVFAGDAGDGSGASGGETPGETDEGSGSVGLPRLGFGSSGTPARTGRSPGGRSTAGADGGTAIRRPAPPSREPSASGPAGVLEEFSYLVQYLFAAIGLVVVDSLRLVLAAVTRRPPPTARDGAGATRERAGWPIVLIGVLGFALTVLAAVALFLVAVGEVRVGL